MLLPAGVREAAGLAVWCDYYPSSMLHAALRCAAGCRYPARLVEGLREAAELASAGGEVAQAPTSLAWLAGAFQPAPASAGASPAGGKLGFLDRLVIISKAAEVAEIPCVLASVGGSW